MPLVINETSKFKKHFEKYVKSKRDIRVFKEAVNYLVEDGKLPAKFDDHQLRHQEKGVRDFHIKGDLVVIYYIVHGNSVTFIDVGTHNKLFSFDKLFLTRDTKRKFDFK